MRLLLRRAAASAATATSNTPARRAVAAYRRAVTVALGLGLVLGAVVRALPVLRADFPLGDGGLFLLMVDAVRANNLVVPETVPYNGHGLPFAYPPFGFMVAALAGALTELPSVEVLRLIPLAFSLMTLFAFVGLARDMVRGRLAVAAAVVAFALLPLTYRWFVMGAGVTRAPGLLFAIFAAQQAYRLYTRRQKRYAATTAVALALTALSHPNATWFAGLSALVLLVSLGRDRVSLGRTLVVGLLSVLLAAPWWSAVLVRHGLAPFLSAPQNGNPGMPGWALLIRFTLTQEPLVPFLACAGFFGLVVCAVDRRWLLPAWFAAACVFDTRYSGTFAMVPLALLVGVAAQRLARLVPPGQHRGARPVWAAVAGGWVVLYVFLSTLALPGPALHALPAEHLTAMGWVADRTPADARFLVVAPEGDAAGSESEWFPVLTRRVSLGAYQGLEWLPMPSGPSPWERYDRLQACGSADAACLDAWASDAGLDYTHVYLRRTGTRFLEQSLLASPDFDVAYTSADVLIVKRRVPATARGDGKNGL